MFSRRLFLVICFFLTSCHERVSERGVRVEILPFKTVCFSLYQQLCLKTRSNELFYSSIEGFEFIWGHSAQLSLNVVEIANPPADGSDRKYVLDEVISDIEDSVGTKYSYELVELLDHTITKESESYYFLGQVFECHIEVDCDLLVDLNNSGGLVNLVFEYIGSGRVLLVQWN